MQIRCFLIITSKLSENNSYFFSVEDLFEFVNMSEMSYQKKFQLHRVENKSIKLCHYDVIMFLHDVLTSQKLSIHMLACRCDVD